MRFWDVQESIRTGWKVSGRLQEIAFWRVLFGNVRKTRTVYFMDKVPEIEGETGLCPVDPFAIRLSGVSGSAGAMQERAWAGMLCCGLPEEDSQARV